MESLGYHVKELGLGRRLRVLGNNIVFQRDHLGFGVGNDGVGGHAGGMEIG